MFNSQRSPVKPLDRLAPRHCPPPFSAPAAGRRSIPFRMLADAFGTEDEDIEPEPDWADFVS